jgi:hypothetical protein
MTMAQQGDASMAQPGSTTAMPPSAHKKYASEGYGSRAEVFLTGFGLVGSSGNGNAITEQQTDAGGVAVGYRFHLNASSVGGPLRLQPQLGQVHDRWRSFLHSVVLL